MRGSSVGQLMNALSHLPGSKSGRWDLHCHTTCSDGDDTPAELLQHARKLGLAGMSITDHDTTRAYRLVTPLIPTVFENQAFQWIPGVEITTVYNGWEVHLLAYQFDPQDAALQMTLAAIREQRRERMTARLRQLPWTWSTPEEWQEPERALGRRHLARELLARGYATSQANAFQIMRGLTGPLPQVGRPIEEVIASVRQAGGWCSLAHPGLDWDDRLLQPLCEAGLVALEVYYPWSRSYQGERIRDLALRFGLKATGGSDYHGASGRTRLAEKSLSAEAWQLLDRSPPGAS